MPLYIADYLADTTHLTRSEHGAYLLLLMSMWRAGGRLPADDAKLAKLAQCSPDEWSDMRATILEFFKRRGGLLTHKRVTAEIARYENRIERSRKGGKSSASKKTNENNEILPILVEAKTNQPEPEPEPVYTVGFSALWGAASDMMRKRSSKKKAEAAYRVVCTRTDPTTVLNALLGYLQNDEDVKRGMGQPALDRWLRDGRWEAWASTPATERTDDQWRAIVSLHSQTGRWSDELGPRPGEPGCMVPPHFLIERVA